MKLPPWLVIGMLTSSVLAVLVAAGWWWVTWPERTALEFIDRLANTKNNASWRELMQSESDVETLDGVFKILSPKSLATDIIPERRSLAELVCGRQQFAVTFAETKNPIWKIIAERGKISGPLPDSILLEVMRSSM